LRVVISVWIVRRLILSLLGVSGIIVILNWDLRDQPGEEGRLE
jgi:hypothetical protein